MNTLVPSVIYRMPVRTVGADVTFTPAAPISGNTASFTPSSMASPTTASSGSGWANLGQSLLNLGGNIATGFANLSLQKAQLKYQAEANRPIMINQPGYTQATPFPSYATSGGTFGGTSGGMGGNTLLYAGGALALGLIAIVALRKN
jgi:hypothetical protein